MSSATLQMREHFETCLGIIRQASLQILPLLNIRAAEGKDPQWFFQQLEQARMALGSWGAVAKRLNLNDSEISQFTLLLRHLQQLVPQYESGQEVTQNQLLAALRFCSYLEHVRFKQPLLGYSTELSSDVDGLQQGAQRQMRGIELILKGLVNQAWGSEAGLVNQLKSQFGADKVRRWLKRGERGDVLSGMKFSELALLVVDKKEFAHHYAKLYRGAPQLGFLIDQRKTLQIFLDGVRQIRNDLMHKQPLTTVQVALLDNYYGEMSSAVQKAFSEGRSKVNPAGLLEADNTALQSYLELARKNHSAQGGDAEEIRDSIERYDPRGVKKQQDTTGVISTALWSVVGVAVVAVAVLGLYMLSEISGKPEIAAAAPVVSTVVQAKERPEYNSPRDMLANMGITWDENNLRAAINRNDTRIVRLFMQGGMNWKVYFAEQALAADYGDVLTILLQYRPQMDEARPCRRLIGSTELGMKNGQKLTSLRKQFLAAFCSSDAAVKRQKEEVDRAQIRFAAQKQRAAEAKAQGLDAVPVDEQTVKIQQAIYNAMR